MTNFVSAIAVFAMGALLASCDLQPKITSIPDSIGDFISARYPAMLADPDSEPEIYNSAVSDYGVYASPELYGSVGMDEYVNYAGIDDYILKPEHAEPDATVDSNEEIYDTVQVSDDDKSEVAGTESEEVPVVYDVLDVPEYENGELNVPEYVRPGTIVVRRGDTLYALAREHNTTLENLADANGLKPPYTLRIGQILKLEPDTPKPTVVAEPVEVKPEPVVEKVAEKPKTEPKIEKKSEQKKEVKPVDKTETKTVSKPTEQKVQPASKSVTTNDVRVPLKTITVARGDTLYSVSRRYEVPVNDLAVMNGLSAPFTLSVGQKLRVPDLAKPETPVAQTPAKSSQNAKTAVKAEPKQTKTTNKPQPTKNATKVPEKSTSNKPVKQNQSQKSSLKTLAPQKSDNKKQVEKTQPIAARSSSKFTWPVRGTILSHYGAKTGGLYNDGINISAALNTTVVAAENGVVAYAGNEVRGMGNLIIIQHSGGWMTVYAHLNSMSVRRGARVSVGQKIGTVGQTGKVTKPQLHFEIRKGTKSYNPTNYLKK